MRRRPYAYAQPIGFLSRRGAVPPYHSQTSMPQAPPFALSQPYFPTHPGGAVPPVAPPVTGPTNQGIGSILQNLFKGQGAFDINSVMANTQKVIGVVNQLGSVVRNMSPMLDMLKGLSDDSPLIEMDDDKKRISHRKRRRKSRSSKRNTKSKSTRNRKSLRKRS